MEGRLDGEAVKRDEFAELTKSCLLLAARTTQEEKLRGAAAVIANAVLEEGDPEKMGYSELDHFMRSLDALSIGAIRVLAEVYRQAKEQGLGSGDPQPIHLQFVPIRDRLSDVEGHLLPGLILELDGQFLVHLPNRMEPSINAAGSGNFRVTLTPLGRIFVERVLRMADRPSAVT